MNLKINPITKRIRSTRRPINDNILLDLLITFSLFILSKILFILITPFGVVYEIIYRIKNKDWVGLSDWFYICAASDDQAGGVYNMSLFNHILIKSKYPDSHWFGNKDEVISSVLGKNKYSNTQTKLGYKIDKILEFIDPGHTNKSREFDELNPKYYDKKTNK